MDTTAPPPLFVALGTNLGDRERNLARGVSGLAGRGLRITRVSSVYETEPVGGPAQGPYLNAVLGADTEVVQLVYVDPDVALVGVVKQEQLRRHLSRGHLVSHVRRRSRGPLCPR